MGTIFALSWLITWFGHVLSDFRHVVRLYDFFLACHPLMPIYFAAVVGTGHKPAARFTITHSSLILFPQGKPGDYGKMRKGAFPRLMPLDPILRHVNGSAMGKEETLCQNRFGKYLVKPG